MVDFGPAGAYLLQELLLMMLQFAHHCDDGRLGACGSLWVVDVKTAFLGKCCAEDGDPKICLTGILRALVVSVAVAAPPSNDGGVHPNFLPPRRLESDSSLLSSKTLKHYFTMSKVHMLDYVAGNVRSLVNAIEKVGYTVEWVKSPAQVAEAEVLLLHDQEVYSN